MHKLIAPVLLVLGFAALLIAARTRSPSAASMARVAVARSNQEAKRLFNIEPFKREHGHLRPEGQQSVWEALTSSGGNDITAKVTFDERGAVVGVEERLLIPPTRDPGTNSPGYLQRQHEQKLGIPEVMP